MVLTKQDYIAVPAVVSVRGNEIEPTQERIKRAAFARVALGYQLLSLAVGETRPKLTLQDVEEGLREANVQIFDNKDVGQYKANITSNSWRGHWETTLISEYEEPIPEFAIDTAIQIKKAIPEAVFYIEHFEGRQDDPFLSFKVPGIRRRFVVEVWDEPDFEAERKEQP